MADAEKSEQGIIAVMPSVWEAWMPVPGHLRWSRPAGTTTRPDVLQQLWQEQNSGRTEWRPVPVHIEEEKPHG